MPLLDVHAKTLERKRQLAALVAEHLQSLGHEAEVVEEHRNDSGHLDRVIVHSSLGLVHTVASKVVDPNSEIPVSDRDGSQVFLQGKTWVAYGWVDRSGRTLVQFLRVEHVLGRTAMARTELVRLADRELSVMYPAQGATGVKA